MMSQRRWRVQSLFFLNRFDGGSMSCFFQVCGFHLPLFLQKRNPRFFDNTQMPDRRGWMDRKGFPDQLFHNLPGWQGNRNLFLRRNLRNQLNGRGLRKTFGLGRVIENQEQGDSDVKRQGDKQKPTGRYTPYPAGFGMDHRCLFRVLGCRHGNHPKPVNTGLLDNIHQVDDNTIIDFPVCLQINYNPFVFLVIG